MLNPIDFFWIVGLGAIAVILLGWRLSSANKPDPLEWHIPLAPEKPPCGRWKYLGPVLLDRKGITVTRFHVCTNCGKSEIYSGRTGWTCETFKHLLLQVKKAERDAQEEESRNKDRIEHERKDKNKPWNGSSQERVRLRNGTDFGLQRVRCSSR